MRYFLLVFMFLLVSCSRKSAVELYNEGVKAENGKEFTVAVDRFGEVVDKYDQTPFADSALYRLALVYNNDLHETEKAVKAYQLYCQKYSSSNRAPTALFLSAFLMNNDLHQIDSARAAYEKFLRLYPNHDLAQSAKFELANLGKDPAEFTPQNSSDQRLDTASTQASVSK
jgi:TolA-binding protein